MDTNKPRKMEKVGQFHLSQVEKVVDERLHELDRALHQATVLDCLGDFLLLKRLGRYYFDEALQKEQNVEDGCSEFVADRGGEVFCLLLQLDVFLCLHPQELLADPLCLVSDVQRNRGPARVVKLLDLHRDKEVINLVSERSLRSFLLLIHFGNERFNT